MTARNELSDWLAIADRINTGEFRGCDRSTRESLTIGLRSINDPTCQSSLDKLEADHEADVESRKRKVKV